MIEKHYVDRSYKEAIYEREAISSSSYGNIAISHPLNNEAKSSAIAVSINPNPVLWGENKVNLIFMLSLAEDDKELFADIFDFITDIINEPSMFNKILSIKHFDEFVNALVANN